MSPKGLMIRGTVRVDSSGSLSLRRCSVKGAQGSVFEPGSFSFPYPAPSKCGSCIPYATSGRLTGGWQARTRHANQRSAQNPGWPILAVLYFGGVGPPSPGPFPFKRYSLLLSCDAMASFGTGDVHDGASIRVRAHPAAQTYKNAPNLYGIRRPSRIRRCIAQSASK